MSKANKKTDLQNLPACVAEFIKQVVKKMRYRRKVRRDVQAELAAHFEDELKDCAIGEEREQKAKRLIAEFGDIKLLAVLLRRAKKRCRPLWRTVVARTFQFIGVLILCFILYAVWFVSGRPVITTNYVAELNKIVRPTADESLNAYPLYNRAVDLYKNLSDDFLVYFAQNYHDEKFSKDIEKLADEIEKLPSYSESSDFQEKRKEIQEDVFRIISPLIGKQFHELDSEQKQIARRWIQEHNDALKLIVEGSRLPNCWRKYENKDEESGMMGVLLPNLGDFRRLTFALRWRAFLKAEEGQFEDAFNDIDSNYRFGQHLRKNVTLIDQLVGIAIEAIALQACRNILGNYDIDLTILTNFQRDFEQIVADENFIVNLKFERLMMYDEIQRCFTSDRFGKGHLYLPRFRKISDMAGNYDGEGIEPFILDLVYSVPYLFGHPNKEETLASVNELHDYLEQLSLKTAAQIHTDSNAIDDKINKFLSDNIFIGVLTPAFKRIFEISNRLSTDVGATLSVIAILRYKADKGQYPQNLDQLITAGYLRQLPMDYFSDKPLVYKKTDDDFLLYSYGPNCTDDGGEPGRDRKGRVKLWVDEGDVVFWPIPES